MATAAGFLNDLVITSKAVYVTDSQVARLVVVPLSKWGTPPAASAVQILPITGDLVYTAGFNANGIRQLPTGELVIVKSNNGELYAVNPRTGDTDEMAIEGADLTGGDGLEIVDDILYVVRGLRRQRDRRRSSWAATAVPARSSPRSSRRPWTCRPR